MTRIPHRLFSKSRLLCGIAALSVALCGCGQVRYDFPYTETVPRAVRLSDGIAEGFAKTLCVTGGDLNDGTIAFADNNSAGLFDLNRCETLFAHRVHEKMNPASLTKVMTAIVALENGTPDQVLIASDRVLMSDPEAQSVGLRAGDEMTLDQALRMLLIYSANDVAVMIAENIGGSVEGFIDLMNRKALAIGATNSFFKNPHGLTAEGHYTTAYDMYLIFNEAMKHSEFLEIVNMSSYTTEFRTADGSMRTVELGSTNRYLRGLNEPPVGVTVIGGKTGTTTEAGHCLILLSRDTLGNPYIAVMLGIESTETLYNTMSELLAKTAG